jgi:hypothetical protein
VEAEADGSRHGGVRLRLMTSQDPKKTAQSASDQSAADKAAMDPLDAAAIVARHVELDDIWISSVRAHQSLRPDELIEQEYEWRISKSHEYTFAPEAGLLIVAVKVSAFAASSKTAPTEAPHLQKVTNTRLIEAEATASLQYRLTASSPPPEDNRAALFAGFASVNGLYNAWPYLREQMQTLTSRMGIPPLVLPVYRVPRRQKAPANESKPAKP